MNLVKVECMKCSGTGYIRAFNHVMGGVCFSCGGKGYKMMKSIPKPTKSYYVYIQMEENSEPRQWLGEYGKSEKEVLKKVQKIALRGCYAKWIDTIQVKEATKLLSCSELQETK